MRSVKGPGGGYLLAREPNDISIGEILRAVEDPLAIADCVQDVTRCQRAALCPARPFWQRLTLALAEIADNTTLQDLCQPVAVPQREST